MSQWTEIERLEKAIERLQAMVDRLSAQTVFRRPQQDEGHYLIDGSCQRDRVTGLVRKPAPEAPDPRLIDTMQKLRRMRAHYLDPDLFADPAWDILLELYNARLRHKQVCVTSLCIASEVPASTALRWISLMVDRGLLERRDDPDDRRRAFVSLTEPVARRLSRFFADAGGLAGHLI
jgi:DNA-binding MarR family transcriptional regulator